MIRRALIRYSKTRSWQYRSAKVVSQKFSRKEKERVITLHLLLWACKIALTRLKWLTWIILSSNLKMSQCSNNCDLWMYSKIKKVWILWVILQVNKSTTHQCLWLHSQSYNSRQRAGAKILCSRIYSSSNSHLIPSRAHPNTACSQLKPSPTLTLNKSQNMTTSQPGLRCTKCLNLQCLAPT